MSCRFPDWLRVALNAWPATETRERRSFLVQRRRNAGFLIDRAVAAGFLTVSKVNGHVWDDQLTRTSKVCPLRRPNKARGRPKPRSLWPYAIPEHVKLVRESPLAAYAHTLEMLTGEQSWEGEPSQVRVPLRHATRATLGDLRRAVEAALTGKQRGRMWCPFGVYLATGQGMAMVLALLRVRPVFDAASTLVRFAPLSYEEAETQLQALGMLRQTARERWEHFTTLLGEQHGRSRPEVEAGVHAADL